jgi:hypothetical protein
VLAACVESCLTRFLARSVLLLVSCPCPASMRWRRSDGVELELAANLLPHIGVVLACTAMIVVVKTC